MQGFKLIPLTFGFADKNSNASGSMQYLNASGLNPKPDCSKWMPQGCWSPSGNGCAKLPCSADNSLGSSIVKPHATSTAISKAAKKISANGNMDYTFASGSMSYLNGSGSVLDNSNMAGFSNVLGIGDSCGMRPIRPRNRGPWNQCKANQQAIQLKQAESDAELAKAAASLPQSSGMGIGAIIGISVAGVALLVGGIFLIRKLRKGKAQ